MSSFHVHHLIHSAFCMGEGLGSLGIEVCGRLSPLLCWMEASLLHSGTPGHEALKGLGIWGLLLWAWTNQIGHVAPFCPPCQQVGLFDTGTPLRATFRWWVGEGYLPSWLGRSGWLDSPFSRAPMAWHHLGDFGLMICSPESPLLAAAWMSVASRALATVAERVAHPLNFVLPKSCGHECPAMGISCHSQSFFTGVSPNAHEPIIHGMDPSYELSLGACARGTHQTPSLFCLKQCRWPLMPKAFFDWVQDVLANMFSCFLATTYLPWQPL